MLASRSRKVQIEQINLLSSVHNTTSNHATNVFYFDTLRDLQTRCFCNYRYFRIMTCG